MNKVMISLLISFPNKSMENHLTVFSMNCKIVFDYKNKIVFFIFFIIKNNIIKKYKMKLCIIKMS